MYKNSKILAIIPARGGSKRIPKKNIKLLAGKPLIAYSINKALNSKYIDRVLVSTDDSLIAVISKKYGAEVPFIRPKRLSKDTSLTVDALRHAVSFIEKTGYQPEIIVLIQATTPLIRVADIDKTIKKLFKDKVNSCFTVREVSERPEWMYRVRNNKISSYIKNISEEKRRRDKEKLAIENGGVYVMTRDILMKNKQNIDRDSMSAVFMPKERSIDIDEPIDFIIVEALIKKLENK